MGRQTFRDILHIGNVFHVYQSLWTLENWISCGYESFLRTDLNFNPEEVFQKARKQGILYELDTFSIKSAVASFPVSLLKENYLFVNIFPSTLLHDEFPGFLTGLIKNHPEIVGRLVVEMNEALEEEEIWKIPLLAERMKLIKEHGMLLALDDIGKGVSSLQKVIEFKPDFVKLDRYFATNLAADEEKQRMISLLVNYCQDEMTLILEGVEEAVDLAIAKSINVPIAQGYLLGKPMRLSGA